MSKASRPERWLLLALLLAVTLRLVWGLTHRFPVEELTSGDAAAWWGMAHEVAEGRARFGGDGADFLRAPLFAFYLGALVALFGSVPWIPVVVSSFVSASGTWFCARIAQAAFPRRRWLAPAAAFLYALDPIQVAFPALFLNEALATPLTLAFAWALLEAFRSRRLGPALVAGALGGVATLLRVDLLALVLPAFVGCAWLGWRQGLPRPTRPWLAGAALACALLVPWSAYASRVAGEPILVARVPNAPGLSVYTTSLRLDLNPWLACEHGYMFGRVAPETIPSAAFDSPQEEQEVRELLASVQGYGRPPLAVDQRLRALARERVERSPLRHAVWFPWWRSLRVWLHYEKGTNRVFGRGERELGGLTPDLFAPGAGPLWSLAHLPFAALCFLGFVASWALLIRSRGPRALLAGLVLARTYSLLIYGVWAQRAAFEVRYLTCVQPLAMLLALYVLGVLWERRRAPS